MSQDSNIELLRRAVADHQAGRRDEARALYRQILAADPENADALHLLGVLTTQAGNPIGGAALISQSIAARAGNAAAHFNLASAYRAAGRHEQAVPEYRRAIELDPAFLTALNHLAATLVQMGQWAAAAEACDRALRLAPDSAEAHFNRGNIELGRRNFAAAAVTFRRVIDLGADQTEVWNNLSLALNGCGRFEEAALAARRAIEKQPRSAPAHNSLGNALRNLGQTADAVAAYRGAIALQADYARAHVNLGAALHDAWQLQEAVAACRRAIEIQPDLAEAHYNLGNALLHGEEIDPAIEAFERSLKLRPDYAEAMVNLAAAHRAAGRLDEALKLYQRARALLPENAGVASNLAYLANFREELGPVELLEETRGHARAFGESPAAGGIISQSDRALRIGYVSPDLRGHPVGRFLAPLLSHHDRAKFEICCYSDTRMPDDLTARLRNSVQHWREVGAWSDNRLAEQIRADRIDILIDLALHTAANRLAVFAMRPAALQMTYLAYPGTSGLPAIQYRITDVFIDPPGENDEHYSEQLLRLPHTYWCYEAPAEAPLPGELPAVARGWVTFACLNQFVKLSPAARDLFASVLAEDANSRLVLYAAPGRHRGELLLDFQRRGIDPRRIEFISRLAREEYFLQYRHIDIALDSFPHAGGATTCDALWMGVPVVTLRGKTAVGRSGVSILSAIGLPELIAEDIEDYRSIVRDLRKDLVRLARYRAELRGRMISSPLMNAEEFAGDVEAAYIRAFKEMSAGSRAPG
jgi:predicted O-linked N-acetylglucosamine transferase (SPINDLY family)